MWDKNCRAKNVGTNCEVRHCGEKVYKYVNKIMQPQKRKEKYLLAD